VGFNPRIEDETFYLSFPVLWQFGLMTFGRE
jgi:hypothetical protein